MIDRFGRFLVKFRQSKKYPVQHTAPLLSAVGSSMPMPQITPLLQGMRK
jgi:hypothetical protein